MNVTETGDMFHCDCGFSWRRGHSGAHECGDGLRAIIAKQAARMEWLEDMNTLHGTVEMLYVVDGYQLTYTYYDSQIGEPVHGATLAEAIDKAIAAGWKPMTRGGAR